MAGFRTAYLQREVYLDLDVVGDCKVGDVVKVTTGDGFAYMQKTAKATAEYIVAQSDQTIAYGHVPVENRDYRYDPTVKATVSAAPTAATTTWKHVALYKIINIDDVVFDADGGDVA